MNRKSKSKSPLCLLAGLLFLVLTISGCKTNSDVQVDPSGSLLSYNGCKQFQDNIRLSRSMAGQGSDCLEYQYNGRNTLVLKHVNAAFNCCPGEIVADIEFTGNTITITENEKEYGCRCICLFDLDFEVNNLLPGTYTIRVVEPYVENSDQVIQFTVKLHGTLSATYCLERNYYPWGP
jgi:hypothetical protein